MPSLRIQTGPNRGQTFPVGEKPVTIGREATCTVQINDSAASRAHAEVFRIGEMCFVRDLNSRNNTFVNDQQIQEELLRAGDKIRIGSTLFVFEDLETRPRAVDSDAGVPGVGYQESDASDQTVELNLDRAQLDEIRAAGYGKEAAIHLGILLELSKTISAEHHLKPLMDKIIQVATEGIRARFGILFLKDARNEQFVPRARAGADSGSEIKVSRTIIRKCIQHGRPILTSDAAADSRFKSTESVVQKSIHSVICVPLVSLDRIVGILYFESTSLQHPFKPEDLDLMTAVGFQAAIAIQNVLMHVQQRRTLAGAIRTLVTAMEKQNPTTQGHSERVSTYSAAIAQEMGLSEAVNSNVQLAALLHDIGKIGLGDRGAAPAVEEHVRVGVQILENMPGLEEILPGIKYHHEKIDGSGVPEHLTGDKIPIIAKIIAVANEFDHLMTSKGESGAGLSTKEALLQLRESSGKTLDSDVVAALILAHRRGTLFSPKTIFDQTTPKAES